MKNIAIIPARGGSKRIPRKNIKPFMGKPIMAYSIETALKSNLFDVVMVSTDDEEIADIARQYGAEVPFMRSEQTANDFATTNDVLKEVIRCYAERGHRFDYMCCIYATAPLVQSDDLAEAFEHLKNGGYKSVYPVVEFSYPIWRCLDVFRNGTMSRHWPEYEHSRSQDLPKEYHDSGTFYWYDVRKWTTNQGDTGAIILPEIKVQDIDNETDWQLAEMKYRLLHRVNV